MKSIFVCAMGLLVLAGSALAQSPAATASVTIGGKKISINYSAPSVKGRKVFAAGGVISQDSTYPVWRAGANAATLLHTDAALDLNGLAVPKGDYTLFVDLKNPNQWELIVNKQTGQGGLDYAAAQDFGRTKMTMAKPAASVEVLKYTLTDLGGNKGKLTLEWENHSASVPFTVK